MQRKEQFNSFDLNLPLLPEKIPKIQEKKEKKLKKIIIMIDLLIIE